MPLLVIFLFLFLIVLAAGMVTLFVVTRMSRKLIHGLSLAPLPRSVAASLKESRQYGQLIMRTARQYPPGVMRDRLNRTLQPVDQWLANLDRLESGLKKLYSQRNLRRELRQAHFEIDNLRRRMLSVSDKEAALLRELLASKKQHLAVLNELQLFQTQAELKIRKIASDLGATHAEMLLIIAKGDFNENRFRRLDENLQEHLHSMRDMLGAMDELGYSRASS